METEDLSRMKARVREEWAELRQSSGSRGAEDTDLLSAVRRLMVDFGDVFDEESEAKTVFEYLA